MVIFIVQLIFHLVCALGCASNVVETCIFCVVECFCLFRKQTFVSIDFLLHNFSQLCLTINADECETIQFQFNEKFATDQII